MQIPVNKDLDDYHEDFFKGMTLRQTTMAALTLVAGVGSFLLFHMVLGVPQTIALYLVFPVALPFALIGFMKVDGRTPLEYLKKRHDVVTNSFYNFEPMFFSLMEEQEEKPKTNREGSPPDEQMDLIY